MIGPWVDGRPCRIKMIAADDRLTGSLDKGSIGR